MLLVIATPPRDKPRKPDQVLHEIIDKITVVVVMNLRKAADANNYQKRPRRLLVFVAREP